MLTEHSIFIRNGQHNITCTLYSVHTHLKHKEANEKTTESFESNQSNAIQWHIVIRNDKSE